MGGEAGADFGVGRFGRGGAGIHHKVHGRQFLLAVTEGIPRDAFEAVAPDGIAGGLDPYGKTEPGVAQQVGACDH